MELDDRTNTSPPCPAAFIGLFFVRFHRTFYSTLNLRSAATTTTNISTAKGKKENLCNCKYLQRWGEKKFLIKMNYSFSLSSGALLWGLSSLQVIYICVIHKKMLWIYASLWLITSREFSELFPESTFSYPISLSWNLNFCKSAKSVKTWYHTFVFTSNFVN